MTDPKSNAPEEAPALEATDARQGRPGKPVLWILVISLVLVCIALFGAWAMRAGDLAKADPNGTSNTAGGEQFDTPAPPETETVGERAPSGSAASSPQGR